MIRRLLLVICVLGLVLPSSLLASSWPADLTSPLSPDGPAARVSYPVLLKTAGAGGFDSAVVDSDGYWVAAADHDGKVVVAKVPRPVPGTSFGRDAGAPTAKVSPKTPDVFALPDYLRDHGVTVLSLPSAASAGSAAGESRGIVSMLLIPLGVAVIFAGMIVFIRLRRRTGGGQGGKFAKHGEIRESARVEMSTVRFCDVAGCDEAVEELAEVVLFIKEPHRFTQMGARMPRGVILSGPPGTGKTLLAKAVAGEAKVPFYSVSGSDFVELYVGTGAARVRDLFAKAQKHPTGAVIFFDEIDAIGKARGAGVNTGDSEREATLNQLLASMDGFDTSSRVMVIAATNRLDVLDPALVRPGRFDRSVTVDLPAFAGRLAILETHSKNKPIADPADLERLARVTGGSSGADLANLVNEAAIMAARADRRVIEWDDLIEGQLRALAGPRKHDPRRADHEREAIAWHEAGHVLTAELCPLHPDTQRVTILARGQAAGLAMYGQDDHALVSPQELHERMVVALGGRAAEQIAFGRISSGAANDLEQVNRLARHGVEALGFSPRVGQVISQHRGQQIGVSEQTRRRIDEEISRLVDSAYADAIALLEAHRPELDHLAQALLDNEQLERADIEKALGPALAEERLGPRSAQALPTDQISRPESERGDSAAEEPRRSSLPGSSRRPEPVLAVKADPMTARLSRRLALLSVAFLARAPRLRRRRRRAGGLL